MHYVFAHEWKDNKERHHAFFKQTGKIALVLQLSNQVRYIRYQILESWCMILTLRVYCMRTSTSSLSCLCCQVLLYLHLQVVCLPLTMNIDEQISGNTKRVKQNLSVLKQKRTSQWKMGSRTNFNLNTTSKANHKVKLIYVTDTRSTALIEFQYLDVGWKIFWSLGLF